MTALIVNITVVAEALKEQITIKLRNLTLAM
jgi:hypothetical protein